MKKYLFIFIVGLIFIPQLSAQSDKNTEKIKTWLKNKEFEKVSKFKKKNPKSLSTEAIFYKGLAEFYQDNDEKAIELFDIALEKGPATDNLYFYKGMSHMYLSEYKDAIESMDKALEINPDFNEAYELKGECHYHSEEFEDAITALKKAVSYETAKSRAHLFLGLSYMEKEEYPKAIIGFKNALSDLEVGSQSHNLATYNIGLCNQLNGDNEAAKKEFISFLKDYPVDYQAIAKMVQVCNALGDEEDAKPYRKQLFDARKDNKLEKSMRTMYCFDQFKHGKYKALGFENFDERSNGFSAIKYRYLIKSDPKKDEFDVKIYVERDTSRSDSAYVIRKIENDTAFTYSNYTFTEIESIKGLRNKVKLILDGEKESEVFPNYSDHVSELELYRLKNLDLDGSSFAKAVIAESIPFEYEWLREFYPGHNFISQALVFEDGVPYDILTIKYNGKKIEVYFNISSFFGKNFK